MGDPTPLKQLSSLVSSGKKKSSGVQSNPQRELVILATETFFGGTHHLHVKVRRENVSLRFLVLKVEVSSEHRGD